MDSGCHPNQSLLTNLFRPFFSIIKGSTKVEKAELLEMTVEYLREVLRLSSRTSGKCLSRYSSFFPYQLSNKYILE